MTGPGRETLFVKNVLVTLNKLVSNEAILPNTCSQELAYDRNS